MDRRKSSVKRSLSPGPENSTSSHGEPGKKQRTRKVTDPLLLLVQQDTPSLGDLETQYQRRKHGAQRQGSSEELTNTLSQVRTDVLGSRDSLVSLLEQSRRGSCGSFPNSCLTSCASHSYLTSCSNSCLTSFSSSYTSWTKPVAGGQRPSDSCVPHTSILDQPEPEYLPPSLVSHRSRRLTVGGGRSGKRDSSADTCKDIDNIEDFDLDEGLVEELEAEEHGLGSPDGQESK